MGWGYRSPFKFPQVAVCPRQRGLDDSMQAIEPDGERHFGYASDSRRHVIQRNRHPHDEGIAQVACSKFRISRAAYHFQDSSPSIRLMG